MKESKAKNRRYSIFLVLFLLTMLSSISFASSDAWKPAVYAAIALSVSLGAIAFAIIYSLNITMLKPLIFDELGQIILGALFVGILIFSMTAINNYVKSTVFAFSDAETVCGPVQTSMNSDSFFYCPTVFIKNKDGDVEIKVPPISMLDWALKLDISRMKYLQSNVDSLSYYVNRLGYQSSKTGQCRLLGIGFSVAGCSSWSVLRGPVGQMINSLAFSIMNLQSERIIIEITKNIALSFALPLGILLRALYFTRKAGSTIIALALAFYIVFPAVIIAGQASADMFLSKNLDYSKSLSLSLDDVECDPFSPKFSKIEDNLNKLLKRSDNGKIKGYPSSLVDRLMFFVIGRNLIITALSLSATLGFASGFSRALGANINITSIARLS